MCLLTYLPGIRANYWHSERRELFARTISANVCVSVNVQAKTTTRTFARTIRANYSRQCETGFSVKRAQLKCPKPNFTKRRCEGSLDIVVIPLVLVFPEFLLVSAQPPPEDGRFVPPNSIFFWGGSDFHGVPPLTKNTPKMSFTEDLVKIRPVKRTK